MTHVYIVTSGEYSDYHIEAVFMDKALAEAYADHFNAGHDYGDYTVEKWESLDDIHHINEFNKMKERGYFLCDVKITHEGDVTYFSGDRDANDMKVVDKYRILLQFSRDDKHSILVTRMWAKSRDAAIKIANERRTAIIAANRWEITTYDQGWLSVE